MAKVTVQLTGGAPQIKEATTIAELKNMLGLSKHVATVNGEPEESDYELSDYEFVTFTESVKGA